MIGYEAMQLRTAHRKKEREREKCAAGNKPVTGSNKKKRVNKTKGGKDLEPHELGLLDQPGAGLVYLGYFHRQW